MKTEYRILLAMALLSVVITGCNKGKTETVAIFGGSFSVIPASEVAKDCWKDELGVECFNYGVGGAGFSNRTQKKGKHIQWQVDSACAPGAPVYDTYVLWASTNDFMKVNDLSGDPWDYTERDGFDESKLETQCGGINYAIRRIREKAPKARILFMTSTKCFRKPGLGTDPDYDGEEGHGMNEFVAKQILCCEAAGIPFLDQFTLPPFDEENFQEYVEKDNLHLNKNGYKALSMLQVSFLSSGKTIRGRFPVLGGHSSKDWAKFYRYAALNAAREGKPRVVLFGDSITDNWPKRDGEFFENNPDYVGRGIGGQTSSEALVRFRSDVIDLAPEYVAILIGTNDVAENNGGITLEHVLDNIRSMVDLARANGIRPVLCTVLPSNGFRWRKDIGDPSRSIYALNAMIRKLASEEGLPLADYWAALDNGAGGLSEEIAPDGVHPVAEGYHIMESVLKKVIE